MTNVAGIGAPGIDSGIDSDADSGADSDADSGADSDSDSDVLIPSKKYPACGGVLFIKYERFYSFLFASIKSLILSIIACASRAIDCNRHADCMSILASVALSIFITSIISHIVRLTLIIPSRYLSRSDMMRSFTCASVPESQLANKSVNFSNKSFLFMICPLYAYMSDADSLSADSGADALLSRPNTSGAS